MAGFLGEVAGPYWAVEWRLQKPRKDSGPDAAGKAPDVSILHPGIRASLEVTSRRTITDSSTKIP